MIKRAAEMKNDIREQMRGGKGSVSITEIFQTGEYQGKARMIARISLEPGCSIGMHIHEGEEEIYYVLSGEAVFTDSTLAGETVLKAGDASLTLGDQSHAIRNDSTDPLEFMAIILLY